MPATDTKTTQFEFERGNNSTSPQLAVAPSGARPAESERYMKSRASAQAAILGALFALLIVAGTYGMYCWAKNYEIKPVSQVAETRQQEAAPQPQRQAEVNESVMPKQRQDRLESLRIDREPVRDNRPSQDGGFEPSAPAREQAAPPQNQIQQSPPQGWAKPTGQPYAGAPRAITENGVEYTGLSCVRRNGAPGREGRGPNGKIGCWER